MEIYQAPIHADLRAMGFHRRLQKAEGALLKLGRKADFWEASWLSTVRNRNTIRRKLNRLRSRVRAHKMSNPLERIIEMGRQFP
jgi:hypothetical protein